MNDGGDNRNARRKRELLSTDRVEGVSVIADESTLRDRRGWIQYYYFKNKYYLVMIEHVRRLDGGGRWV